MFGGNLLANYGEMVAVILFGIGFSNLLLQKNLIKKIIGFNIMDTAIYLFLAQKGYIVGRAAPIVADRTELTIPANMDRMIEKNGKFCTNATYNPSFFRRVEISSRSSV